jgi:hypothetical protein
VSEHWLTYSRDENASPFPKIGAGMRKNALKAEKTQLHRLRGRLILETQPPVSPSCVGPPGTAVLTAD